jgi:hypothetical protein
VSSSLAELQGAVRDMLDSERDDGPKDEVDEDDCVHIRSGGFDKAGRNWSV